MLRIALYFICGISGYYFAVALFTHPLSGAGGLLGGCLLATLTFFIEEPLKNLSLRHLSGSVIGLALGMMFANLLSNVFLSNLLNGQSITLPLLGVFYGICGYTGIRIGYKKGEEIFLPRWNPFDKKPPRGECPKILDTSVIIDGRISDITETGFLEGPLYLPQFVLNELQHIADASDPVKRTRGKRGLEVLGHIQKQAHIDVKIIDKDYPSVRDVDAKLVELAKETRGKIVTNDSNLNKVAQLQGIEVLNINGLANALKPVVLPGEEMNVKILKEGKEMGQGVAYLDDGTMIVVDNGRKQIGKTLDVLVTSVLQTPAGRMIFARLKEDTLRENRGKGYDIPLDSEF